MGSTTTSNVYVHVIEDVIDKVRDEFINDGGPGEGVLAELQGLWELKMMQAGAILGPIDRSAKQKASGPVTPNTVHDLNLPYEGTEEYETPTADLLFPPTPLPTPLPRIAQTPLPGMAHTPLPGTALTPGSDGSSSYNIPTGGTPFTPNEYSSANNNGGVPEKAGAGRPCPYMSPPSSWLNQRPPLDVNVAYVEGREEGEKGSPSSSSNSGGRLQYFSANLGNFQKRIKEKLGESLDFFMMSSGKRKRDELPSQYHPEGYIPQQDGAGDVLSDVLKMGQGSNLKVPVQEGSESSRIPQFDGPIPDPYDDVLSTPNIFNYQGVVNEDYNIVNTPMPNEMQAATPAPVQNEAAYDDDDGDEPLNEDDDEDLDDLDQGEDLSTTHLVLAQFDKVTRTKSRWKCTLKDGIMHINNKDVLFNKATGEFDF